MKDEVVTVREVSSRVGLACALIALTLAGAGPALAGTNTHLDAKIKPLASGKLRYQGKVRSSSDDCLAGRKVKISAPGVRIGKAKTADDGKFSITGKPVETGVEVRFKLKAKGTDCIGLELTVPAP